ncbi:MAG: nucleoside/nucleotide kinase family protein [Hyphomicrobiales bacterium]
MSDMVDRGGLLKILLGQVQSMPSGSRLIVAIAGAPASGKSAVSDWLCDAFNRVHPESAAILPMDGYHYDDAVLTAHGSLQQKGAPHTFDVGGLVSILKRLRENTEAQIAVPRFDRDLEIARAGAVIIQSKAQLIIVEGNYLLLKQEPWQQLLSLFDLKILVSVEEQVLEQRLRDRWTSYNLEETDIQRKVFENDLPNGRLVIRESAQPDIVVSN